MASFRRFKTAGDLIIIHGRDRVEWMADCDINEKLGNGLFLEMHVWSWWRNNSGQVLEKDEGTTRKYESYK